MNHTYEIEIKSLLGTKAKADDLVRQMKSQDPNIKILGSHKQLNHYFVGGSLQALYDLVKNLLGPPAREKLKDLAEKARDFSVRTREADGKIILVVKASVDDTTSENGTARLEWEHTMDLGLDALDALVLKAGFAYQAKWSRERSEYKYSPLPNVTLSVATDKNAGYGYLAEFELVVDDPNKAEDAKNLIRSVMGGLNIDELPQDRLARMFDFYNKNWREYYGTDKTFTIN